MQHAGILSRTAGPCVSVVGQLQLLGLQQHEPASELVCPNSATCACDFSVGYYCLTRADVDMFPSDHPVDPTCCRVIRFLYSIAGSRLT